MVAIIIRVLIPFSAKIQSVTINVNLKIAIIKRPLTGTR